MPHSRTEPHAHASAGHAHRPAHGPGHVDPAAARAVRTRRIVLGLALLAAIAIAAYYQFRSIGQQSAPVITRTGFDFVVTWKCLACNTERREQGGIGPTTCPKCGKNEFYPHVRFACGQHGAVLVAFKYDEKGRPQQIRVPGGQWLPPHNEDWSSNAVCPKCRAEMLPADSLVPAETK